MHVSKVKLDPLADLEEIGQYNAKTVYLTLSLLLSFCLFCSQNCLFVWMHLLVC